MNTTKSYTDAEESAVADSLMMELGLPLDRNSDIWRALKLGIAKGIGMGYDKLIELYRNAGIATSAG